jgi:RES domain-containing protein
MEEYFYPSEEFFSTNLPIIDIGIDCPMYRLNKATYTTSIHFGDGSGNKSGRFDGANQGYKILYTGQDISVCFIESFGSSPYNFVETEKVRQTNLFLINTRKSLKLADLTGSRLVGIRGDSRVTSGPYELSRAWGKAIWSHQDKVDGIRYRSRYDNDRYCYGIFENSRTRNALDERNLGDLLIENNQMSLGSILDEYKYGLI